MSEIATLRPNGFGYGGYMSLEIDGEAWKRLGSPFPRYRPIGGRGPGGLPRAELQDLVLKLRIGEHEGERKVVKIVEHVVCVFLVISALDVAEFSNIEIVAATLIDPAMVPTPNEQLLRGMLHE